MFIGESSHTVDAKHRVFVPKRFQEQLERDADGNQICVVSKGLDGCIYLFSEDGFQRALSQLDTNAFTGEQQRKIQRLFFAYTSRVHLDSSGRLLIPEKLRSILAGSREVSMVGCLQRAEIWPKATWEAMEEGSAEEFDALDRILTNRSPGGDSGD